MGRLINIRKSDEDDRSVFYRFGSGAPPDDTFATLAIDKRTGEMELVEVDSDAAVRRANDLYT